MEGGREDGKEGRRTRRRRSGYRTKNKNPTRQCGEQMCNVNHTISKLNMLGLENYCCPSPVCIKIDHCWHEIFGVPFQIANGTGISKYIRYKTCVFFKKM